jgi:galactoside O-acetyltransferase
MPFLRDEDVSKLGLKSVGRNVRISDKASFYGAAGIAIGNNSRIDDFCVLSAGDGGMVIGDNVHIAVFVSIIGAGSVKISDFCNVSSRVAIYSSNDDYSGEFMTNPTVPRDLTNVTNGPVVFEKHVIVGSGSVVLPGVTLGEGVAIGALSLVNSSCDAFGIYAGVPAKRVKERSKKLLALEHGARFRFNT